MCRFFYFTSLAADYIFPKIPESKRGEAPYDARVQAAAGPAALGV